MKPTPREASEIKKQYESVVDHLIKEGYADDKDSAEKLKRMSYDGRLPDIPWATQNISTMGYHYYMTPDKANMGLENFPKVKSKKPIRKDWDHYQPIDRYSIFKSKKILTTSKL